MMRKPPAPMPSRADFMPLPVQESREPHSIRFSPSEWDSIRVEAQRRMLEPAVFVRALTMYALHLHTGPTLSEAALGITPMGGQMLAGSRGTRRF